MRWNMIFFSLVCGFTMTVSIAGENRNVDLLVSSCAACHGTNGHSVGGTPKLTGLDEHYFVEQMQKFATNDRPSTVMHHHATGYTEQEIKLMAKFFSQQ